MDKEEIIALSIVALAAFLALRCFLSRKGGGCCGSNCSLVCKSKPEKKDRTSKPKGQKNP